MRRSLALAPLLLAALAPPATGEPSAPAATDPHPAAAAPDPAGTPAPGASDPSGPSELPDPALPDVSAAPRPVPAAAFELLPPGVRAPVAEAAPGFTRSQAAWGPRVVERVERPFPGADAPVWIEVEYTVDPELDAAVRAALGRSGVAVGQVVLLDPATGEIFAYVTTDPIGFPATRTYPTASLMKVVTAAAALRSVPEATRRKCRYRGSPYVVSEDALAPPLAGGILDTFPGALAISNNQCFARIAVRDVGKAKLLTEMAELGLFDAPAPRHPALRLDALEDELDLGFLGSGLAGSFISPLGAARLAAVLADGELVRPYWIAAIRDADGNPLPIPWREDPRRVWPADVTGELRELLVGVTETGTARRAFHADDGAPLLGGVRVAGKTGTLNGTDPPGRYQWFIGVAPAEAPRVAIAAVVVRDALADHLPAGGAPAADAPPLRSSASDVAATTLRDLFCAGDFCDPARAERLHERAAAREAAARAALEERRLAALEQARLREEQAARARAEATARLDAPLRALGRPRLDFPRDLRKKRAKGQIVLLVGLSPEGRVLDVAVDRSDLPHLDAFVSEQVRRWRFTPPTQQGQPVATTARLPISIEID
jgi:TonB family protein